MSIQRYSTVCSVESDERWRRWYWCYSHRVNNITLATNIGIFTEWVNCLHGFGTIGSICHICVGSTLENCNNFGWCGTRLLYCKSEGSTLYPSIISLYFSNYCDIVCTSLSVITWIDVHISTWCIIIYKRGWLALSRRCNNHWIGNVTPPFTTIWTFIKITDVLVYLTCFNNICHWHWVIINCQYYGFSW